MFTSNTKIKLLIRYEFGVVTFVSGIKDIYCIYLFKQFVNIEKLYLNWLQLSYKIL